jgi:hypothetical protein
MARIDPFVVFPQRFPDDFLKGLVKMVTSCYQIARTIGPAYGMDGPDSWWNEPYPCRSLIETGAKNLTKNYPQIEALQAWVGEKVRPTPYVVLKSGQISLTISRVVRRCLLPREAAHRKRNAQGNRHLFTEYEEELPEETPISAICAHVPHEKDPRPIIIDVIFPNWNYSGIIGSPIDLLGRFAEVSVPPVQEVKIEEPTLELKKPEQERKAEG